MGTQGKESHNSGVRASGNSNHLHATKSQRFRMTEAKIAACHLAKRLCLPLTFRNLYVIELAIEAEITFSSISVQEAANQIADYAIAARETGEHVDYFWFEDCGWRYRKLSFRERDEHRMRQLAY